MATVRLQCPHCGRVDRLGISKPLEVESDEFRRSWLAQVRLGQHRNDAVCGLKCHLCGGWSIGVFNSSSQNGTEYLATGLGSANPVEGSGTVELLTVFPSPTTYLPHGSIPAPAQAFFLEAREDLRAERNPAGIIARCRSVLDLCLKNLNAEGKGRRAQVADLKAKGLLTISLSQWADRLWDDGNDAIHDLTGSTERARQHVTFLELFFEVAFALPAQVAAAELEHEAEASEEL